MNVSVDPVMAADELRQQLYAGNLVVLTRLRALRDFVEYTRGELTELFRPHNPEYVHEHIDPAEMAKLLGQWKPQFIHSEKSRKLVRAIIQEAGFPVSGTHYDLPKPRTSFPVGHLTTGVAFAFPWHREDNAMSFDVRSFDREVPNTSDAFDYYQNNASRLTTATQVTAERQARPRALDHKPGQELVILPAPGEVLLFSGAQLHVSTPNTSGRARYSVDFRTVDVSDLMAGRGAPLADVHCTGTAIRDFLNVADESSFDEQTVVSLFGAPPPG